MINFRFSRIHLILSELGIDIRVSNNNKPYENLEHDLNNTPKHIEAMSQSIKSIKWIVDICPDAFAQLKSPRIATATKRLARWLEDEDRTWSELNTRALALRDIIETELNDMYYYQYPKAQAQKLLSWKDDWAGAIKGDFNFDKARST